MSRRINAKSHPKSVASRKHFFARNYKRVKLLPKNAQKELGFELTKKNHAMSLIQEQTPQIVS